jgi:hypothetical protein
MAIKIDDMRIYIVKECLLRAEAERHGHTADEGFYEAPVTEFLI